MGWTVRGSNPGGGENFRTCPDRTWGPPSLLYNGYLVLPGGKERPGRDAGPSPLLVSLSWKSTAISLLPLWAVGPVRASTRVHFTLPLPYIYIYIYIMNKNNFLNLLFRCSLTLIFIPLRISVTGEPNSSRAVSRYVYHHHRRRRRHYYHHHHHHHHHYYYYHHHHHHHHHHYYY